MNFKPIFTSLIMSVTTFSSIEATQTRDTDPIEEKKDYHKRTMAGRPVGFFAFVSGLNAQSPLKKSPKEEEKNLSSQCKIALDQDENIKKALEFFIPEFFECQCFNIDTPKKPLILLTKDFQQYVEILDGTVIKAIEHKPDLNK